jgi:Asp-tRNA(Asn)/Glu-tRNA(Gln) amidotransferase A subunit family amidase
MTPDTLGLTAEGCMALLDAGDVSCVELVDAYLARIEQQDGGLNCYLPTRTDAPREQPARRGTDGRSGPRGRRSRQGHPLRAGRGDHRRPPHPEGHRLPYDAGVVTPPHAAGLILLGKPTWTSSQ